MIEKEITLKKTSWKNIIECIRASVIESKGSFWAAIQSIESQLEEK